MRIITVTKNGYIKITHADDFKTQTRGGRGIIAAKASERAGSLVCAVSVSGADQAGTIIVFTAKGMGIRFDAASLPQIGRYAVGVKAINLQDGDFVVSAVAVDF